MKLLLCAIFGCAALLVESSLVDKKNDDVETKCLNHFGLNADRMGYAATVPTIPEDDRVIGEFFACVWKGRGIMNEDGTVNLDTFREFIKYEIGGPSTSEESRTVVVDQMVKNCKDVPRATELATAIKLKNCVAQAMIDLRNL